MAWRPSHYLIAGVLDNTVPNKVTGWLQFAGMKEQVTIDLEGNFHRDIRGAKIRLKGEGREDDPEAAAYMNGFSTVQKGKVGDITAGLPPQDYVSYPYVEIYSDDNGRVVLELDQEQVEVVGQPIPWVESDPVSRQSQAQNMAEFLTGLCRDVGATAVATVPAPTLVSDPEFSHWVVADGQIIGEARDVEPPEDGLAFAYVRLFVMPEMAEYGSIEAGNLRPKGEAGGRAG